MYAPLDTLAPVFTPDPLNRHHPLNRGLVAHWLALPPLDGGPKWYDLMGLNHGTLTNMATTASGWRATTRPGGFGHLLFDATDDFVDVSAGYASLTDWTVSAWVNTFTAGNQGVILRCGSHAFQLTNSACRYYDGSSTFDSAVTFATNTWTHLAVTKVGNTLTHYLNGVANNTYTMTTAQPAVSRIGTYSGANFWNGYLDDIRACGRGLSAAEVRALHDLSRTGYPGVLNRWPALQVPMLGQAATAGGTPILRSGILRSRTITGVAA